MRMVRVFAGVLLLIVGIPALLAGAALGADLSLDLRAELRAGWTAPVTAGLLAAGMLLVISALGLLLRPVRPREVVFVVEPDQVPVLAGRLGVTSLSGLGASPARDGDRALTATRQLASVGAPLDAPRPAIGPVPSGRPATLADLVAPPDGDEPAASDGVRRDGDGRRGRRDGTRCVALRPSEVDLSLAWPPASPEGTATPTPMSRPEHLGRRLRPAAPVDPRR